MTDEIKEVSVIAGPYSGKRLTMPTADADAAINDHWARDPHSGVPYGEGHEPLSEEERAHAVEAATAWANTAWAAANIPGVQAPEPPPPEGGEETMQQRRQREQRENAARAAREQQQRTMRPEDDPNYKTRGR